MRKALQTTFATLLLVVCFVVFFPPMVLFPTANWRLRMAIYFARVWSRGLLWFGGVRLVVKGREHLRLPAIYTFNHTSNLDFLINASIAPHGSLVFGKRELARIPLLGWVWLLSGHPMIRRDDRDDWQAKLDLVARRLATGRYATIVAPEGTRSHGKGLLPFKKGPFHLALQSKAPIVPWVLEGVLPCMDARGLHRGTVTVTILPPIPTTDWTAEGLDAHVEAVRDVYAKALGVAPAPQQPPPAAAPPRPRPPVGA